MISIFFCSFQEPCRAGRPLFLFRCSFPPTPSITLLILSNDCLVHLFDSLAFSFSSCRHFHLPLCIFLLLPHLHTLIMLYPPPLHDQSDSPSFLFALDFELPSFGTANIICFSTLKSSFYISHTFVLTMTMFLRSPAFRSLASTPRIIRKPARLRCTMTEPSS